MRTTMPRIAPSAVMIVAVLLVAPVRAEPPSYAGLIRQTEGLLHYLPFDEQPPGKTLESVESGFAPLGKAVGLNGGHLRVPDLGSHDDVSVEMWLKLSKPAEE